MSVLVFTNGVFTNGFREAAWRSVDTQNFMKAAWGFESTIVDTSSAEVVETKGFHRVDAFS